MERARHLTSRLALGPAELACQGREAEVRGPGLLGAALHRPQTRVCGAEAHPGPFVKAAALLHSPLPDRSPAEGSERWAWLCTTVLLDLNGADVAGVDQDRAYGLVAAALGRTGEVPAIAEGLRELHAGA